MQLEVDSRQHAPATLRNRDPLLAVLKRVLPSHGLVLEIASGTGEHVAWFAPRIPHLTWQPSDANPLALKSIAAWSREVRAGNIQPPVEIDACLHQWPVERANAVLCVNMIHISPWDCTLGLMAGAGRILPEGGVLVLYGPFRINNQHISLSNAEFDQSLQTRDPSWGVRDLETVQGAAEEEGLHLAERISMPANNHTLVFVRGPGSLPAATGAR